MALTETPSRASIAPVRFAVLGPVRVWRGDVELKVGPPQQRATLAQLLASAGQPVSLTELIDFLWPSDPPNYAANVVHRYVGALRRQLEPGLRSRATGHWLARDAGSYRLRVDTDSLDLLRFRELAGQARLAAADGRSADAVPLFVQALNLWRGACAAGIEPAAQARPLFTAIDQERTTLIEEAADSALHAGHPRAVLSILREVAGQDPLAEPLQARLILLLAAAGHQAEALTLYQTVCSRLADELGIDPGNELRDAHERVLHQHLPRVAVTPPSPQAKVGPTVSPAQLPADLPTFTGRCDELALLHALVEPAAEPPSAVLIVAIDGMAGIGKTTLAVHWAHQAVDQFPDGQLYADLCAFESGESAVHPGDILRGFLDALGVPVERVPDRVETQMGLYRSLLANRRMLVVLDNVRDVEQVRPLLPGSPGCMAMVTSRNQLTGLVTAHDARLLTLEPFSVADAGEALTRRLGPQRLTSEPEALDEIVALCAGLPLAVAIVAARATFHRKLPLSVIASELRDARTRLDVFNSNDTATDIRTVFSWSYQSLSHQGARLFRLMALSCGPDISGAAVASLAKLSVCEVRPLLAELTQARLLTEHQPGRFLYHDLLRAYATELTTELDADTDRRAAVDRLLDFYLQTSHSAHVLLRPHETPTDLTSGNLGVVPVALADYGQAMNWFSLERPVLNAAVLNAANNGFGNYAWRLALTLQQFYQRQGYWHDWAATMRTALRAAEDLGDLAAQARTHRSLAGACHFLDNQDEALAHLQRTQELFTELGYTTEQAYVHSNVGAVLGRQGHYDRAIEHHLQALKLYRTIGHGKGQATALEGIGWCHARLGDHERAIGSIRAAMDLYRRMDDRNGEGDCWAGLGESHHLLRQYEQAVDCHNRSIALYRGLGNRADEAYGLVALGDACLAAYEIEPARTAWKSARIIMNELRLPQAAAVSAKLASAEARSTDVAGVGH